ncbi:MAG TPA: ABC transporter ATP-binding protein, partial [Firmicutes bacterium]|nr:ABC transporter ATP-binding protein [Bacillota bacterium]
MKEQPKTLLQMNNVTMRFGGVVAVNGVNINLSEGRLAGIIGPNGAGKT